MSLWLSKKTLYPRVISIMSTRQEKLGAEPKVAQGAVVVVINATRHHRLIAHVRLAGIALISAIFAPVALAANLPKDRADVLYHSYDGGGIQINGPSVLVRKDIKNKVSLYGNYYVDQVSSASIDVITSGASAYEEERTEYSLGADYLYDKVIISISGTQSTENDYDASTASFDISQEFFGDMTTLSLGYTHGDDTVSEKGNDSFEAELSRRRFRLGVNQILTPKWMLGLSAETVSEQGFLNNPYRFVHYLNSDGSAGSQKERYPNTRNSDAIALRTIYRLPYRASIRGEIRNTSDNWAIKANNFELRYLQRYKEQWTLQASIRSYNQSQASFYSDLFEYPDAQNFLARDKEMSEYSSLTFGVGVYYEVDKKWSSYIDRTTINLQIDHMQFDYKNFRNATGRLDGSSAYSPGEEPLYSLKANVIRFFVSVFY